MTEGRGTGIPTVKKELEKMAQIKLHMNLMKKELIFMYPFLAIKILYVKS